VLVPAIAPPVAGVEAGNGQRKKHQTEQRGDGFAKQTQIHKDLLDGGSALFIPVPIRAVEGRKGLPRDSGVSCAVSKILVIDDSKPVSLFLRHCLEKAGYEVEEWLPRSDLELPHHLRISAPDLILTDYFMPGLSGAAVARLAFAAPRPIPVIVLTALREEESIAKLLRAGARQVLSKPIEPAALLQAVRDALAGSAKREPLP